MTSSETKDFVDAVERLKQLMPLLEQFHVDVAKLEVIRDREEVIRKRKRQEELDLEHGVYDPVSGRMVKGN